MGDYQHYIRLDEAGTIVYGFSSGFETPQDGDILIAESEQRHFHEVFPEPLINDRGQYRFRWDGEKEVERSEDELFPLSYWKQEKIKEINSQRDAQIQTGFTTNAVASTPNIQMGYDRVDKDNYQSLATMLNLDPSMTVVPFLTGIGMVAFTRNQFIQVIKDAFNHESALVYKGLTLKAQVDAATDKESLDAIAW